MNAVLDRQLDAGRLLIRPTGAWVIERTRELDLALSEAAEPGERQPANELVIDLSRVADMDTAGAFLLARLERHWAASGGKVEWQGVGPGRDALIERVRDVLSEDETPTPPRPNTLLQDVGETVTDIAFDARDLLAILGAVVREIGMLLLRPSTFRGSAVVKQMDVAGLRAVPIVILISFLIGGIVAQQGAFQLEYFGAAIFTVDLVGILSLREVAPLLTAIMVAGRSGSAITAELGSMQMREEIDALRVMGMSPVNVLILPRVIAMILVLPLLTFIAGIASLAGAMLTLWAYVDIPPAMFIDRLRDAIDFSSFFSGLFKAPFMALIISLIACSEGMEVRGSAESLGRHTTAAVVKSIFMVIMVDGVFAVFYGAIDY